MTASPRIVRRFDRLWWQLQQGQSLVTGVIKLRPMLGGINIQKTCDWKLLHASVHFDHFLGFRKGAHGPQNPLQVDL